MRSQFSAWIALTSTVFATLWLPLPFGSCEQLTGEAERMLDEAAVSGGLVAHLGCTDAQLSLALIQQGTYLCQCLPASADAYAEIQRTLQRSGQTDRISATRLVGTRLPYVDNLVTLLIVEEACRVSQEEMLRVLQPDGVLCIQAEDRWEYHRKPVADGLDIWTHYLHDASNNAVSRDAEVGPPHRFQWIADPQWTRSHDHLASLSAMVSAGGRVFYIVDEAPVAHVGIKSRWFLVARNAYNGVLLWKRKMGSWEGHLRGFRSGPNELARRLVTDGSHVYVTLAYGEPISQLDAATGETEQTYTASENALEFVVEQDRIFAVVGDRLPQNTDGAAKLQKPELIWHWWTIRGDLAPQKRLVAIRAHTGETVWEKRDADTASLYPATLGVSNGHLVFQSREGIFALNSQTGEPLWQRQRPTGWQRLTWSTPTLVIHQDVVLSGDRAADAPVPGGAERLSTSEWIVNSLGGNAPPGKLIAYSLATGDPLWECECREGYNSPVDVLVANQLVWTGSLVSRSDPGITLGRDLHTGEVKLKRDRDQTQFAIQMGHHRCYRNKATDQFLVLGRDGIEFIDTTTGKGSGNPWVRGTCQYGVMPCNGLIYSPPHSCACHVESKLNSFNVLASDASSNKPWKTGERLIHGPAFGSVSMRNQDAADGTDWPTYRGNSQRTGTSASEIPANIDIAWKVKVDDGPLSCPVVARDRVFVASVDRHQLCAFQQSTGVPLWKFTTAGRIDSPPTVYGNAVLFGCADGWIYCLKAETGELAWQFLAASSDHQIVVRNQLESAWPLHGSVLVSGGVLYAVAGRTPELEGGLTLYRLDPMTGRLLSQTRVSAPALPDVLSSDGESIFLRHRRFDLEGRELKTTLPHLYSPAGFLDDSWWHRTYWMFGAQMRSGWGGWSISGNQVPAGRILVVDDNTVYGFGRLNQFHRDGAHVGLGTTRYKLFASSLASANVEPKKARRQGNPADNGAVPVQWERTLPLMARALLKSKDRLVVAGPPDLLAYNSSGNVHTYYVESQEMLQAQEAAWRGDKGGLLMMINESNGEELTQVALASPPVWDGMACANQKLFVATVDGHLLCLGSEQGGD